MVALYSLESSILQEQSSGALLACRKQPDSLNVIKAKDILSTVAMIPHTFRMRDAMGVENSLDLWFGWDKLGIPLGEEDEEEGEGAEEGA